MRSGRWTPGWKRTVDGIEMRVVPGKKFPGDLRLEWYVQGDGWVPVTMASAYLLVDFLCENEDERTPHEAHWQVQGGEYFMRSVQKARRHGWEAAAETVREQRRALATPPPILSPSPTQCETRDDEGGRCQKATRHDGAHRNDVAVWPQTVLA
jgi:hypothetical protein